MKENCELVSHTKELAVQRKLDATKIVCPYDHVCNGSTCEMIEPTPLNPASNQTDKFFNRLGKWNDLRLARLHRQE